MKEPNIEWERFRFKLPKSGADVEIIREFVFDSDDDADYMEVSRFEPN